MRNRSVKGMRKYGKKEGKALEEEDSYIPLALETEGYNASLQ